MGLLDRLNLLIRSNLNSTVDHSDDPDRALSEALDELEATLQTARKRTARVMRDERKLEREVNACLDEENRWEDRAFTALKADDEDAAREALRVKHRIASRRREHQKELETLRAYLSDLLRGLDGLEAKLDTTQRRRRKRVAEPASRAPRRRLEPPREDARYERTRSFEHQTDDTIQRWEALGRRARGPVPVERVRGRLSAQEPLLSEGGGPAFEAVEASLSEFSRMEDKIANLEARIDAEDDLTQPLDVDDPLYDPELADLEARFRRLEQGPGERDR